MSFMENTKRFRPAFTLVELLVVIAIIGILASMLLAALAAAKTHALRVKASLEINELVTAIQGYESAYGRFPVSNAARDTASDFTYGGIYTAEEGVWPSAPIPANYQTNNSEVIAILMDLTNYPGGGWTVNTNHTKNPQQTKFLNATPASDAVSPGVGTDLVYRDPCGDPYVITMDLDNDGQCKDAFYSMTTVSGPNQTKNNPGLNGLINPDMTKDDNFQYRGDVMVWSVGQNKKLDPEDPATDRENRDNILSWK